MNITLSLDDDLVKEVRKIAVERDTTLTGLVRSYLQEIAKNTPSRAASAGSWKRFEKASRSISST